MVAKRGMIIGGGAGRGEVNVGIVNVSGDEMVDMTPETKWGLVGTAPGRWKNEWKGLCLRPQQSSSS